MYFVLIKFSYPEPFLRAVRRGALAKSITGYHKNMVRKQCPVLELANQMPVRIWIWPEPLVAPRVRRALGTRMVLMSSRFDVTSCVYRHSRPSPFTLSVKQKIANFEPLKVHEDQIFEL